MAPSLQQQNQRSLAKLTSTLHIMLMRVWPLLLLQSKQQQPLQVLTLLLLLLGPSMLCSCAAAWSAM
jgi:hypothetical protein